MAVALAPPALQQTIPGRFFARAAAQPGGVALRHKRFGLWQPVTWAEYAGQVRVAASALLALGLDPGDRVGLIGENRPEWLFADLGIQTAGGWTTGIYTTSSSEQIAYILGHAECRLLIVEGEEQLDKALEIRDQLPRLERIIVIDPEGLRGFRDPQVMMWQDFLALGSDYQRRYPGALDERLSRLQHDDVAMLIYTSGTTGPPKGVMLTHANVLWTIEAFGPVLHYTGQDQVLSYLPLCHIAERFATMVVQVHYGGTVHFVENVDTFTDNLREVAPTTFLGVPRIWEKLYSAVALHMREVDPFKRLAYAFASAVGRWATPYRCRARPLPLWLGFLYGLCDATVLAPLRRRLGLHRARAVISTAAPIAPDVLAYFWSIGVPIREVYGQTEVTGPATVHRDGDIRLGTIGVPIPGLDVRLADDGEILIRGGSVFKGYFKDPAATAAALRDGWLATGDVGATDPDGHLRITDRKKDLFITSAGKNIAPQYIENKLKFSPYINDAVVIGDGRRYLVALIVVDEDNVTQWAQDRRLPFTTYADLSQHSDVRDLIAREVEAVNKTLSTPEQVKKFEILAKRLYAEDGEVTPTLKVKRAAIIKKYGELVETLYAQR